MSSQRDYTSYSFLTTILVIAAMAGLSQLPKFKLGSLTFKRTNILADIIKQDEGADPAAVVFDSISAAKARGSDIIIVDTAGRLHNKANLMNELAKIDRVISRELPDASRETLLVLDATTGQNAVHQAEEFNKAAELTGIILTKLDGTAKGGIVIAISAGLGVPVKLVGVGEGIDDLIDFDRAAFLEAILPPAEQMTGDSENEEEGAEQE